MAFRPRAKQAKCTQKLSGPIPTINENGLWLDHLHLTFLLAMLHLFVRVRKKIN